MLSACSSLIAVVEDRNSRVVQFSHFSVKEFLTSDRLAASKMDACHYQYIRPEPAHTIMIQACLGVLLRINHQSMKDLPLADYAAKHFHNHAKVGDVLSCVQDGLTTSLTQTNLTLNSRLESATQGDTLVPCGRVWILQPGATPRFEASRRCSGQGWRPRDSVARHNKSGAHRCFTAITWAVDV